MAAAFASCFHYYALNFQQLQSWQTMGKSFNFKSGNIGSNVH